MKINAHAGFYLKLGLTLGLMLFISACSTPQVEATPTASPLPATRTATPTASPTPTATSTATPIPPTATTVPSSLCTPLEDHEFPEIYQYVSHPFALPPDSNKEKGHHGIDFSYYYRDGKIIDGVNIQSIFSGVVVSAIEDPWPYGNMVIIETPYDLVAPELREMLNLTVGNSVYHLYAHLLNPSTLGIGDQVACGEVLGQVGNTGNSGNPHLHLEVRTGPAGQTFPVMEYYDTQATAEELVAYERWRSSGEFIAHDPVQVFEVFYPQENTPEPAN